MKNVIVKKENLNNDLVQISKEILYEINVIWEEISKK